MEVFKSCVLKDLETFKMLVVTAVQDWLISSYIYIYIYIYFRSWQNLLLHLAAWINKLTCLSLQIKCSKILRKKARCGNMDSWYLPVCYFFTFYMRFKVVAPVTDIHVSFSNASAHPSYLMSFPVIEIYSPRPGNTRKT
jgi:hypothetical protein